MENALNNYRRREEALRRKHERMAKGYVTKLDKNGTYVQVPDNKAGGLSLRIVLWAALVFVGFKVMVLSGLGEASYLANVETLAQGSPYERVGAWLMQIDPVTSNLAAVVSLVMS